MSFRNAIAPLVPFDQAEAQRQSRAAMPTAAAESLQFDDPEITELARALRNDPDLIFEYVHNTITTLPQYGSLKGPLGTLIDGCGTCFDQAELMMLLLFESGYEPKLVMGTITLTISQLTAWLGCNAAEGSVSALLGTGGFSASLALDPDRNVISATINWAWVRVALPVGGTQYAFDPATKDYARKPRLPNLGTLLNYNQTTFLAAALDGATTTSNSIQDVNRANIRTSMNSFTNALVLKLETELAGAGPDDILGGATITPLPLNTRRRNTSLSYATEESEHASVPADRRTTVTITVKDTSAIVFNSSDIYGRRLSLFFTDTVAAVLSLDGVVQRTGPAGTPGQRRIDFAIDHPYPTDPPSPADQGGFQNVNASAGGAFVIGTGFGPVGRGMIERHRRILQKNVAANQAGPSAEPVLGESLAMLSYTWLSQISRAIQLVDQVGDTSTVYQHAVGIVGMSAPKGTDKISGPYLDLAFNVFGTVQRTSRPLGGEQTASEKAAFRTITQIASVLESGTIEQRQPGVKAVSTSNLIDTANSKDEKIFDIASIADYDAVDNELIQNGWNGPFLLANVFQPVTQGGRVIIPRDGSMDINRWKGSGLFRFTPTDDAISAVISGGLNGGEATEDVPKKDMENAAKDQVKAPSISPTNTVPGAPGGDSSDRMGTVGDPVNSVTGSYVYSQDDLIVGSGAFPRGLGFQRSYDSGRTGPGDTMGAGWKHNFDLTLIRDSDGFEGMAVNSPIAGAPSIAAIYVLLDILNSGNLKPPLANFVIASLLSTYWMELLTDNVVRLTRPGDIEHFVRVPDADGAAVYKAPIGSVSTLTPVPNLTYALRTAEGLLLRFGAATATSPGRIASWENAAGVVVNFAYTSGRLTTVASNLGRALTLGYDGNDRLTSVSDGEGRSIGYQYTVDAAGVARLTRFIDTMNKHTNFTYHGDGALWQIFYPARPAVAFITLTYDELGRVKTQTDARGNLTDVYIAGRRTEIVAPINSGAPRRNRQVWYFDPLGRTVAEIQDFGRGPAGSPTLNLNTTHEYDGQSRRVRTTLPEGNSIETEYDKYSKPLTIRRVAKPGSGLVNLEQKYQYVSVASRGIYRKVSRATDPKGLHTHYQYNAQGLLSQITQPAVSRPGTPTPVQPVQTFTYVASGAARGLIAEAVDAEGRVTAYEYDGDGNVSAQVVDAGTGRLNLRTTYVHDGVGNLTETVTPRGNLPGATPADFRTVFTYDAKRRRTAEEQAALDVRTFTTYDADDRVTEIRRLLTPAESGSPAVYQTTTTTYTLTGNPSVVTDPAGKTVSYGYDAADKLSTITLGSGRRTTYNFDAVGRVATVRDVVPGALDPSITLNRGTVTRETRTYSKNSLLATFKDGSNNQTDYAYDGFDRLGTVTHADGSTETMSYDANGNVLTRKTRAGEVITSSYDALNRLSTRHVPANAHAGAVAYAYGYDLVGRMLSAGQDIDVLAMGFGYDTAGRLTSEAHADNRLVTYAHDADGNRVGLTWPESGTQAYTAQYGWDALGRMTQVVEATPASTPTLASYAHDRLSRRTGITRPTGAATTYEYLANDLVELMRHQFTASSAAEFRYGYNSENGLVSRETSEAAYRPAATNPGLVPGSTGYVANALNQYTSVGAAALSYDGNGNLAGDGVWSYGYDPQNRLVSAAKTAGGVVNIAYGYDAVGRRRSRVQGAAATRFLWAGEQEIAEYNSAGALAWRFIPGPGLDEPIAALTPAPGVTRRFNHADALGSVVAVSIAAGSVDRKLAYTVYGVADDNTGPAMRYTGRRLDATTGVYYLRARDYAPMLGRFLQADPIGIAGGINLYAYVGNSPLNFIDPRGLGPSSLSGWSAAAFGLLQSSAGFLAEGAAVAGRAAAIGLGTVACPHEVVRDES